MMGNHTVTMVAATRGQESLEKEKARARGGGVGHGAAGGAAAGPAMQVQCPPLQGYPASRPAFLAGGQHPTRGAC